MHYIKTNNLILLQTVLKCTYGPNTIKLNALCYSVNLIRNHITMTTTTEKTCIYSYCLLGYACHRLKALHNREGKYERRRQTWSGGQMWDQVEEEKEPDPTGSLPEPAAGPALLSAISHELCV